MVNYNKNRQRTTKPLKTDKISLDVEVSCKIKILAQLFLTEWRMHNSAHVVELNPIQLKIGWVL